MKNHYLKKYKEGHEVFIDFSKVDSFLATPEPKTNSFKLVVLNSSGQKINLVLNDSEYTEFRDSYETYLENKEKDLGIDFNRFLKRIEEKISEHISESEKSFLSEKQELLKELSFIKDINKELVSIKNFIDTFVISEKDFNTVKSEIESDLKEEE